jgi:hypothetical protein
MYIVRLAGKTTFATPKQTCFADDVTILDVYAVAYTRGNVRGQIFPRPFYFKNLQNSVLTLQRTLQGNKKIPIGLW